LLSALGDDRNKGKQVTKEKFATFFDALEEVAERHRFARVLGDDEDGRNGLADDVVRLVIPALQRFMQKTKDKEFSKSEFNCSTCLAYKGTERGVYQIPRNVSRVATLEHFVN